MRKPREFTPEQKEAMRRRYDSRVPRRPAVEQPLTHEEYQQWVNGILTSINAERRRKANLAAGGVW